MSSITFTKTYNPFHWTTPSSYKEYKTSEIDRLLLQDKGYHYLISPEKTYNIYIDIDQNKKNGEYISGIEIFRDAYLSMAKNVFDEDIYPQKFYYTINHGKTGSYHVSIIDLKCRASTQHRLIDYF